MIKVTPYNETTGSERFKEFLAKPFTVDMISPVYNDKSVETLFEDWSGKDMINWFRFTNDEHTLEFYPTYYTLKKNKPVDSTKYMMSIPLTINDFINDMDRFDVQLYWTNWIDLNFEPKEYLRADGIKKYFTNLLILMGKPQELL